MNFSSLAPNYSSVLHPGTDWVHLGRNFAPRFHLGVMPNQPQAHVGSDRELLLWRYDKSQNTPIREFPLYFLFVGFCLLVGLIVFGFKVADDVTDLGVTDWFLSWSFSLACTAFFLNQIAASLLITENKRLLTIEKQNKSRGKTLTEEKQEKPEQVAQTGT